MIKAVIFDVDGTLVYTMPDLVTSINKVRQSFDLPDITEKEVFSFVNCANPEFLYRAVPEKTEEEDRKLMLERYFAYYNNHCVDYSVPYDGIVDMLTDLKKEGIKLATLSNKDDFNVVRICNKLFPSLIDEPWGKNPAYPGKPDPACALALCRKLGCTPEEVAYVGDSDVDMQTGRNAGFITIGAAWGYRELPILCYAGAQYIAENASELSDLLKRLANA